MQPRHYEEPKTTQAIFGTVEKNGFYLNTISHHTPSQQNVLVIGRVITLVFYKKNKNLSKWLVFILKMSL